MSLPVGGHGSQKCYKLIHRFEAEVIASLVLIGQFNTGSLKDFIPEIKCSHKARAKVKVKARSDS